MAPVAFCRALARRGVRDLDVVVVPTGGGIAVDLLIGAGCVRSIESSGVQFGEHGFAPHFSRAVTAGTLTVRDST